MTDPLEPLKPDDEVPHWRVYALGVVEGLVVLATVALVVPVATWAVRELLELPELVLWPVGGFLAGLVARLAVDAPRAARWLHEWHRTAGRRVVSPPWTWAGERWAVFVHRVTLLLERVRRSR